MRPHHPGCWAVGAGHGEGTAHCSGRQEAGELVPVAAGQAHHQNALLGRTGAHQPGHDGRNAAVACCFGQLRCVLHRLVGGEQSLSPLVVLKHVESQGFGQPSHNPWIRVSRPPVKKAAKVRASHPCLLGYLLDLARIRGIYVSLQECGHPKARFIKILGVDHIRHHMTQLRITVATHPQITQPCPEDLHKSLR